MTDTLPQAVRALGVALLFGVAMPVAAGEPLRAPMASRNLSPLNLNLGIPTARDAAGLEAGQWRLAGGLHWASHSLRERGSESTLEFDGETQRLDLTLRAGLGGGFTLDVNLPWQRHRGGALDAAIDGWHAFWGLPDGARDAQPRDRLLFAYMGDGGFVLDSPSAGIGDVEASLEKRVAGGERWAASALLQVKTATGRRDDFTGSGELAVGVGLRFSTQHCVFVSLSCHLQAGVVDVGEDRVAPSGQERLAFGGLSMAWRFGPAWALLAQLDAHGSVHDRAPLDSGGAPLWGTLGLRWQPAPGWRLEGAFSEDLAVGTAPDVTFLLRLQRDFPGL
jgi:hypothetical protein